MKNSFQILALIAILSFYANNLLAQFTPTSGPEGGNVHCLVHDRTYLYASTFGGIYRSADNGSNWISLNTTGQIPVQLHHSIRSLAVDDTYLYAGTEPSGVFRSSDYGISWTRWNFGLPSSTWIPVLYISEETLYAGTNQGVYSSVDQGYTWIPRNAGMSNLSVLSLIKKDNYLFAGTWGGGVFRSANFGANWEPVNSGLTSDVVWSFAVLDTILFAGTDEGMYRSVNYGLEWVPINDGLTDLHIQCLISTASDLFAGTESSGLFRSTDMGENWSALNTGLEDLTITSLTSNGSLLFLSNNRIYLSEDNGTEWTAVDSGLTEFLAISALKVSRDFLFAGTRGAGLWKRPLSEIITSAKTILSKTPIEFSLDQNFPNPFNPSTRISFNIPLFGQVHLEIYNTLGQRVDTLIDEPMPSGSHEITFTTNTLPSGIYFYRIQTGEFSQVRKMILIK